MTGWGRGWYNSFISTRHAETTYCDGPEFKRFRWNSYALLKSCLANCLRTLRTSRNSVTEIVSLSQILVQSPHIQRLPSPLPNRLTNDRRQRSRRAQQ